MWIEASRNECQLSQRLTFPISNRLPPEVLVEVFKYCIPNPGDFTGVPKGVAPLLLCRVCSSWRTFVQSSPEFWKKVGLEGVARFIITWLERSRTLPLTIHLKITASISEELVDTIVEILQNCPELLELEVNIQEEDIELPRHPRILHRRLHRLHISIWNGCAPLLDSLTLPSSKTCFCLFISTSLLITPLYMYSLFMNSSCAYSPALNAHWTNLLYLYVYLTRPGYEMLLPKLSRLTLRYCLSGSPGALGRMILSRCPGPEKEGDRLKYFLLVEEQLDADDKECIDEARLQGLTAKIHIGRPSSSVYYDSDASNITPDDSDIQSEWSI
ncbi:hypothetical protein AX17_003735 [Amanita inopinata Kibby_2008]|nr:hypothetical protein AX17_003735 [Amanita inopinata Kibby_2008]